MDATGKSLVEHWKWAADKGLMNSNSASALRAACSQVLLVFDDWQNLNIATLDIEDAIHRFKNKRAKDFAPSSLQVYSNRFRQAVSSFLQYAENPESWKISSRTTKKNPEPIAGIKRTGLPNPRKDTDFSAHFPESAEGIEMIDYPCPLLRDNITARLLLPRDLTREDAERIYRLLLAVCVDDSDAP